MNQPRRVINDSHSPVSDFADLLDAVLPSKRGTLIVLRAYFDASSRPSGVFCVAGYAFAKEQVKKFDKEWWALFGEYGGCHMKDLTHCTGPYKGLDNKQTGELLKQATKIISKRMSFGVVISCDLNEVHALLPRWIVGFEHAYPVCCHLAMHSLGSHVAKFLDGEQIAYFFETGDPYSDSASKFMHTASQAPELKKQYLYSSHTFIEKKCALALQAADVLAWEWGKYWEETVETRKRDLRKSLRALLAKDIHIYDSRRYKILHISGASLERYARGVAALGLMQRAEDLEAKAMRLSASSASKADE